MVRVRGLVILAGVALSAGCAQQQSQPAQQTGRCADAVAQFRNSPEVRTAGAGPRQIAIRGSVDSYLNQAEYAAARGDEETCFARLSQAKSTLAF